MDRGSGWLSALLILAVIGAINWGLVGIFNWNLVDAIFGAGAREVPSAGSRVVYAVVGVAGFLLAVWLPRRAVTHQGGRWFP